MKARGTSLGNLKNEEGQSIIMVTALVVVWIALIGLVVDIGNAYAQRRHAQNSADAAALAATSELARGDATTNHLVLNKAKEYAQRNNIDPNTVQATYFRYNADTGATTSIGAVSDDTSRPPSDANGVAVALGKTFSTYFTQVLARSSLAAGASSAGHFSRGACIAGEAGWGLFPIAVDHGLFVNDRDLGKPTFGVTYRIWGDRTSPGNFHWISWNDDSGHASQSTLVQNMADTSRSGRWSYGSEVYAGPGVENSSSVKAELDTRIADSNPLKPARVLLPIYDTLRSAGNNTRYHIMGFAWFVLTDYDFRGSNKYVDGIFVRGAVPSSEGGCVDYGTTVTKERPPIPTPPLTGTPPPGGSVARAIVGRLGYQRLAIEGSPHEANNPVDVVLVMDTSGSMNDRWAGGERKVETARQVLREFAGMLRPEIGDKIALVHFPRVNSYNGEGGYERFSSSYRTTCGNQQTRYRFGSERLVELTTDVQTITDTVRNMGANGGTPIAGAMREAMEMINGPFHVDGHAKVVILASDGMTNVTLDEKWTGYSGSTTSGMGGCNGVAEAQTISTANDAKEAGVAVFTIAIGDDFSSSLLSAMSSPDPDPSRPHFFVASNAAAMRQIYEALGERVVSYSGECRATPIETAGAGGLVRLYRNGTLYAQTTADNAGNFTFTNVQAGTYTFAVSITHEGMTYDVFTNVYGGLPVSSPTVEVGEAEGTYDVNLYLKTAHPPSCGV